MVAVEVAGSVSRLEAVPIEEIAVIAFQDVPDVISVDTVLSEKVDVSNAVLGKFEVSMEPV